MDTWSHKMSKYSEKFLRIFSSVKFSKFCSKSFHRDTDRRVVCKFCEIWPTGNRWNCALLTWQNKNKISAGSRAVAIARVAPKVCQGQPPTMYSSRFHHFSGVTAKRANKRHKVNPIFGWSLASSRIISQRLMKLQKKKKIQVFNSECTTLLHYYQSLLTVRFQPKLSDDLDLWLLTSKLPGESHMSLKKRRRKLNFTWLNIASHANTSTKIIII